MKSRVFSTVMAFLLFAVAGSFASSTRVNSLCGGMFIPDAEYDTLNVNPAFLVDMQKAGVSLYTGLRLTGTFTTSTNYETSSGTNINSYKTSTNTEYYIQPSLFVNLPFSKNIAAGIVYYPLFNNAINLTYSASNITSNYILNTVSTNNYTHPLKLRGLFGMKFGDLKLGIDLNLESESYAYYRCKTSNDTMVSNYTSKSDSSSSLFGGNIGALYGLKDLDIGATFKLASDNQTDNQGLYSANYNLFLGRRTTSILSLVPGIYVEKHFDSSTAIRFICSADFENHNSFVAYDETACTTVFGLTNYLNDYKYRASKNFIIRTDIDAYLSLYHEESQKGLLFAGFNFSYSSVSNAQTVDFNTNQAPTSTGEEYSYHNSSSAFTGKLASGYEGRLFSVWIPRVGINITVFSFNTDVSSTMEGYNISKSIAELTNTSLNSTSQSRFLSSATLSAGLGYAPVKNLLIEIGMDNFLTMDLFNAKYDTDLLENQKPVQNVSSYNFKLYVNVRYEF